MNSDKDVLLLFVSNSLKVSVLFDMNSEKDVLLLFVSNTLKVSVLFDMNSEKDVLLLFVSNSKKPVFFSSNSLKVSFGSFYRCFEVEVGYGR